MLVKTIRMETDDDKLFSKSAPLLAAASECAYYTVKCSALNAEELRRYSVKMWKIVCYYIIVEKYIWLMLHILVFQLQVIYK
jgi:hypothetical protein